MFTEQAAIIYQLEYRTRTPGTQFFDNKFDIQSKYFATKDEAKACKSKMCRKEDGSIKARHAVLEDDGSWSLFDKSTALYSSYEDPDNDCNWIDHKHYFLSCDWSEIFKKLTGKLIAITLSTTSANNEFVITPAEYDEDINKFIYVDEKGKISFVKNLEMRVKLEQSELSESKAMYYRTAQMRAFKNPEPVNANAKGVTAGEKTVADIEAEILALMKTQEEGKGGKQLDLEIIDLVKQRDQTRARTEYPLPRP